jgi:hypothetical protein
MNFSSGLIKNSPLSLPTSSIIHAYGSGISFPRLLNPPMF